MLEAVHENRDFVVTDNGSDEIIITSKNLEQLSIRVSLITSGIRVVTQDGQLVVGWPVNGLPAVVAKPR